MSEVILHISAGNGPRECEWVVTQLVAALCAEAAGAGVLCELVEPIKAPVASAFLRVDEGFAAQCCGTIRWTGPSPFRPNHKRKNWFVGVAPAPGAADLPDLREDDITYQTLRASGPGGQHVNTTDSAVRATHTPTGLATVSQDQRSQFANKKIARMKLALLFADMAVKQAADGKRDVWGQNRELERGNAVRTYVGERFLRRG
jgi:peptide chain release factor